MKKPKDVDSYIAVAPKKSRAKLIQLRKIIKTTAPNAKEGISYKIPYYDYHGPLIWFGAYKNYVGIFLRPPVIYEHKKDLKGYVTTKSAVHLPMDKQLPVTLIKKLIKSRMKINEAEKQKSSV